MMIPNKHALHIFSVVCDDVILNAGPYETEEVAARAYDIEAARYPNLRLNFASDEDFRYEGRNGDVFEGEEGFEGHEGNIRAPAVCSCSSYFVVSIRFSLYEN